MSVRNRTIFVRLCTLENYQIIKITAKRRILQTHKNAFNAA